QEETSENEKGEVVSRHVYTNGPGGKTQEDSYMNGKLFNSTTRTYDDRGNVIESNSYKPDGSLESHNWSKFDQQGNELEMVAEGPGDIYFDIIRTYNPQT